MPDREGRHRLEGTDTSPPALASLIAAELADAGLDLIVEHDDHQIVISGVVMTEEEHGAAMDIVSSIAEDHIEVSYDIEVSGAMPASTARLELSESDVEGFRGATAGLEERESADPGDFTDRRDIRAPSLAQPMSISDDGEPLGEDVRRAAERGETYVPPTDPVGTNREIVGGFSPSSMDSLDVERSSDGSIGDAALEEAVTRELREDAATSGLALVVEVVNGVVHLYGEVADITDVENAEAVASHLEGVVDVMEHLRITR